MQKNKAKQKKNNSHTPNKCEEDNRVEEHGVCIEKLKTHCATADINGWPVTHNE